LIYLDTSIVAPFYWQEQEALENIKDAIAACLQVRAERGMPLTVETYQVEVVA
jgi:hypothetical protein